MMRRRFFSQNEETLPVGALPGKFSISPSQQVYFSKGNLYYDGETFGFNQDQFTYSTAYTKNHVEYFFHYPTSAESLTTVEDEHAYSGTTFFASSGALFNGWTLPSHTEMEYLYSGRTGGAKLIKSNVQINGVYGFIVIAPDDFQGTLQSRYTLQEIEDNNFVCLPLQGIYITSNSAVTVGGNQFFLCSDTKAGETFTCYDFGAEYSNLTPNKTHNKRRTGIPVRMIYPI